MPRSSARCGLFWSVPSSWSSPPVPPRWPLSWQAACPRRRASGPLPFCPAAISIWLGYLSFWPLLHELPSEVAEGSSPTSHVVVVVTRWAEALRYVWRRPPYQPRRRQRLHAFCLHLSIQIIRLKVSLWHTLA